MLVNSPYMDHLGYTHTHTRLFHRIGNEEPPKLHPSLGGSQGLSKGKGKGKGKGKSEGEGGEKETWLRYYLIFGFDSPK